MLKGAGRSDESEDDDDERCANTVSTRAAMNESMGNDACEDGE